MTSADSAARCPYQRLVLFAFVLLRRRDTVLDAIDMEHDRKPIDWDQGKAESGCGCGGKCAEQNRPKRTNHEKESEQSVSFVNMSESRNHAQHHRDEIARLAFRRVGGGRAHPI